MSPFFGFDFGFSILSIIFYLFFAIFILVFFIAIFRGLTTWHHNNHSPELNVDATVVSKRIDVSHHRHANAGDASGAHGYHTSTSTSYYVTFQFDSGDRSEFRVPDEEYGMIVEGDNGKLFFKGTRFLAFERYI